MFNPCVVIPVYNHPQTVGAVVSQIRLHNTPIILVDDGSNAKCQLILQQLSSNDADIHLLRLDENSGKGSAVQAGFYFAQKLNFSHALQIDADGQHDTSDIPNFLSLAQQQPTAVVSGYPKYDDSVPKARFYGRYLTHVWVWINTLSLAIKDSMCGYRCYPVAAICKMLDNNTVGKHMDFDTDIIVKWYWSGGKVQNIPTKVHYPTNGVSHFRGLQDNWLITKMHTKLFFGMLLRIPQLLLRKRRVPTRKTS